MKQYQKALALADRFVGAYPSLKGRTVRVSYLPPTSVTEGRNNSFEAYRIRRRPPHELMGKGKEGRIYLWTLRVGEAMMVKLYAEGIPEWKSWPVLPHMETLDYVQNRPNFSLKEKIVSARWYRDNAELGASESLELQQTIDDLMSRLK